MKVASWNLCLGLRNKRDYVSRVIEDEKIDVCCLQEADIDKEYPNEILSIKDYSLDVDKNDVKARVAIYTKNTIPKKRRTDLEGSNSNIIVIDLDLKFKYRIINLYRTFNPPNNLNQYEHLKYQLDLIKTAVEENLSRKCIIVGDFNLDDDKRYQTDYVNRRLFEILNEYFDQLDLIQLVKFPTWSRLVNASLKSSVLDHIYTQDITLVNNIQSYKPLIGDHLIVSFNLNEQIPKPKLLLRRNWQFYSKEKLLAELSKVDFNCDTFDVQSYWNQLELKIVNIVDTLVPLELFSHNSTVKSKSTPPFIKCKQNTRKRLLKKCKVTNDPLTINRIKNLNIEIKNYFTFEKRKQVRRGILPGNSRTLWKAVNIAKNLNSNELPAKMYESGIEISNDNLPDVFAKFFDNKVKTIVNEMDVDVNVYNGKKLVNSLNANFMCEKDVLNAIMSLKTKNCEGYDRIPQRFFTDGAPILIKPLSVLFNKVYEQREIPGQWLFAKITPVPKKGEKVHIENYRPIANLCSVTKIFEKLILQRIIQIEKDNGTDITGTHQHGFKKKHSTNTAGLLLQSIIASAMDENNYALMANLDLSAAFDVVNVNLLLKRLQIVGLPDDLIELIKKWLSTRYFYVSIDSKNSYIHTSNAGTIQGSILGPILYAIYTSPLFDLEAMTCFADDANIIRCNRVLENLIIDMQKSLEAITKWLKKSGLKVNENKTELCLFYRKDHLPINIVFNNVTVKSQKTINVLGVIFDSKLQWSNQVCNVIKKAKKAQHAIMLIKKYFNKIELNQLLTSNFYSVLYYNSDIWHIPSLSPIVKRQLLAASASALKICTPNYNFLISYKKLHYINNRAMPEQMMYYKHALLLYKTYNESTPTKNWLTLNFQQNFNNRNNTLRVFSTSNYKVGQNLTSNRFVVINGILNLDWLNESFDTYKVKCKDKFLKVPPQD